MTRRAPELLDEGRVLVIAAGERVVGAAKSWRPDFRICLFR